MLATDLRSLNPDLLEAAEVHGLTTIRVLWKVELPLIWPALISASIWTFTISLASFDVPAIIGMPNNIFTLGTEMYIMANPPIGLPQYGRTSAFGVLVVALSYILMIPYFKALSQSLICLPSFAARFAGCLSMLSASLLGEAPLKMDFSPRLPFLAGIPPGMSICAASASETFRTHSTQYRNIPARAAKAVLICSLHTGKSALIPLFCPYRFVSAP